MHGDEGDGEVADGRVHDGVRVGDDDERESRRTGMPERGGGGVEETGRRGGARKSGLDVSLPFREGALCSF